MTLYLLDTSVVLDLLLNRPPWAADSAVIWEAHRHNQIQSWIAAFTVPTIFYIVRKQAGIPAAQRAVHACVTTLDIIPTDQATLVAAHALAGSDFEDDLQIACAVQAGVDVIVTRDPKGFAASPIPVMTPADLAASLSGPTTP
jgi:predicted nucleic acid-binding protein